MKYLLVLLLCTGSLLPAFSQSETLTVVIIRHGEKNDATGNLSCQGLNRSLLLPKVLNAKFHQFSYLYVPSASIGKSTGHARMYQTVTPLAIKDNLPVNSKYAVNAVAEVAQDVMKKTGTVLLTWEHEAIDDIAAALGVKDDHLHWADKDYDSIWIITWHTSKKGKLKATLTVDKEGLNPPEACNF